MNKATAIKRLAALGFEIDWSVTGPIPDCAGAWAGVIDPIGKTSIAGSCFGPAIHGRNASAWYCAAIQEAESHAGTLEPCTNPDCDMHSEESDNV